MHESQANPFRRTMASCFTGIFVQAIILNITPILFVPFMELYGFSYTQLGLLVGVNFASQVCSNIIFSGIIDRAGYRRLILPATLMSFGGLMLFALSPYFFSQNLYAGMVFAIAVFGFSGGLLEVVLNPVVNAIPTKSGPTLCLMHSFYAWGQVATIICTTVLLYLIGRVNWQIIVIIWAMVPLVNFFMFYGATFPELIPEEHRMTLRDIFFKRFYLLALAAMFFGISAEVIMNQWASAFMERGLALPKVMGDLLGMSGFAAMIGVGRMLNGLLGRKWNMHNLLIGSSAAAAVCYVVAAVAQINAINIIAYIVSGLAVSLLWPGTLVVSSQRYPLAGAWMLAILAAFGNIGATVGPWLTGYVMDNVTAQPFIQEFSSSLGVTVEQGAMRFSILLAAVFPAAAFVINILLRRLRNEPA